MPEVTVTGGKVTGYLSARENSTVRIMGGEFTGALDARNCSKVFLYGHLETHLNSNKTNDLRFRWNLSGTLQNGGLSPAFVDVMQTTEDCGLTIFSNSTPLP